jgi:Pep3/Vps18/deep orange family.
MFNTFEIFLESYIEEKNLLKFSKLQLLHPKDPTRHKLYGWYVDKGLLIQEMGAAVGSSLIEVPPGVLSFILTEFHALLLYPDHVTGVSLLSKQIVFEDYYNDVSIRNAYQIFGIYST